MNSRNKLPLVTGIILFILGIVFGLMLNLLPVLSNMQGMSLWGIPEIVPFDPTLEKESYIDLIHCPLVITPYEEKPIQVYIRNRRGENISQNVLFIASGPFLRPGTPSFQEKLMLKPNETIKVSRSLVIDQKSDAHFLAVRVFLFQEKSPVAFFTRHCGVLLYKIGHLQGDQIVLLAIGLFLILTVGGMILWQRSSLATQIESPRLLNRLLLISGSQAIGLAINLARWQFLANVWLVLSILLTLSIIEEALMGTIFWSNSRKT